MLPKHALLYSAPLQEWGVIRLRNPVALMHLSAAGPVMYPPGWRELCSPKKSEKVLDALIGYADLFEMTGEVNAASALHPAPWIPSPWNPAAHTLPDWLQVDDDDSDYMGLLDTRNGVLWTIHGEAMNDLRAEMDWRIHPETPPRIAFPQSTREVAEVWRSWRRREQALMDADAMDY